MSQASSTSLLLVAVAELVDMQLHMVVAVAAQVVTAPMQQVRQVVARRVLKQH